MWNNFNFSNRYNRDLNNEKKYNNNISPSNRYNIFESNYNIQKNQNKPYNNNNLLPKDSFNSPDFINNNYNNGINFKKNNNFNSLSHSWDNISQSELDDINNKNSIGSNSVIFLGKKPKGLENIGATCYMNATLQCFFHCEKLTKYLISKKYIEDNIYIKNYTVTYEYINLIKELFNNDGKESFAPYKFKDILGRENPLFRGISANDSKDLILFLEQTLAKELIVPERNNYNKNKNSYFEIDQKNEQNVLNYFLEDFKKEKSIIKDLFYFTCKTKSDCMGCRVPIYNFQVSNFLIFPLEKTYNDFNQKLKNYNINSINNYNINSINNYNDIMVKNVMNNMMNNMIGMNYMNLMNSMLNMNTSNIYNNFNNNNKSNNISFNNKSIIYNGFNNNFKKNLNNFNYSNNNNNIANNNFNNNYHIIKSNNYYNSNFNNNFSNNFFNNFNFGDNNKNNFYNQNSNNIRNYNNNNYSTNINNIYYSSNKILNKNKNENENKSIYYNKKSLKKSNRNSSNKAIFSKNFFIDSNPNQNQNSRKNTNPYLLGSGPNDDSLALYNNKPKPKVTLDQCFESYLNPEYLSGSNQQHCNICGRLNDSIYTTSIYSSSNILILILNYGKGILFECDVDFDEKINISKFVENKTCPESYRLFGIIVHIGPSSESGHFIAFCRGIDNKEQWYKLNDAIVSKATFSDIKKARMPYVLFYENTNPY